MMQEYVRILEKIPTELKEPLAELADAIENRLRADFGVTRQDFNRLEAVVGELASIQKRSEGRLDQIDVTIAKLAQAQERTEQSVTELAQAQKRTEGRLDRIEVAIAKLAQAQERTEQSVAELARAQKRTDTALDSFGRTFHSHMGAIGARWGQNTEATFRNAMGDILSELDFSVEQYIREDTGGRTS